MKLGSLRGHSAGHASYGLNVSVLPVPLITTKAAFDEMFTPWGGCKFESMVTVLPGGAKSNPPWQPPPAQRLLLMLAILELSPERSDPPNKPKFDHTESATRFPTLSWLPLIGESKFQFRAKNPSPLTSNNAPADVNFAASS